MCNCKSFSFDTKKCIDIYVLIIQCQKEYLLMVNVLLFVKFDMWLTDFHLLIFPFFLYVSSECKEILKNTAHGGEKASDITHKSAVAPITFALKFSDTSDYFSAGGSHHFPL